MDVSNEWLNSLWPSDSIWQQRSGSTLAQVMACCLMASSHYLNKCCLIISKIQWHWSEGNFTRNTLGINHRNQLENYLPKISLKSSRGQWVNQFTGHNKWMWAMNDLNWQVFENRCAWDIVNPLWGLDQSVMLTSYTGPRIKCLRLKIKLHVPWRWREYYNRIKNYSIVDYKMTDMFTKACIWLIPESRGKYATPYISKWPKWLA